jgi:hypothetical protein
MFRKLWYEASNTFFNRVKGNNSDVLPDIKLRKFKKPNKPIKPEDIERLLIENSYIDYN